MRVLIISAEVWRDDTNGGNVLTNLIGSLDAEVAQIFCNPGEPQNNVCKKYYQMTDGMVIRAALRHRPIGKTIEYSEFPSAVDKEKVIAEQPNKKMLSFFHRHRLGIFYFARNLLWNTSNWKNDGLNKFVDDFAPDVIFAPCYGSKFMLKLTRYIAKRTGKNVISYISDDSYTLRHVRFSPYFWMNRFSVRRQLRKTFPCYSLVYTMTETQKEQCERDFGANMKILRKSADATLISEKREVGDPIRLVYAGGIYLNRYKTLSKIADAIRRINEDGVKMRLDIYTANEITKKIKKQLDDGVSSFIHPSVSLSELAEIYEKSDVALHVESFGLKERLAVRMSFSTKIVDCLASGAAPMAVCDPKQGGYRYLEDEGAAICVGSQEKIEDELRSILNDPKKIIDCARSARECVARNHDKEKTAEMLRRDFEELI